MDGLLLVDKPIGWTSHDVAAYVKRTLGAKKAGHTGTLDPAATGLVIVLVGKATRLARYFEHDTKTYLAVLALGTETDTLDTEGAVVRECPVPELGEQDVESALSRFRGEITQVPPMYSALKVGGRPLYSIARGGGEVERKPRNVTVHDIRLAGLSADRITFTVTCSKGTYIRTLASDIAVSLGSCGHLESLRRTAAGGYGVEGAVELSQRPGKQGLSACIVGMDDMLWNLPAASVGPDTEAGVRHGRRPSPAELSGLDGPMAPGMKIRIIGAGGKLIAVAGVAAGAEADRPVIELETVLA